MLQIIAAVTIVLMLLVVGLLVYNREAVKSLQDLVGKTTKQQVEILEGTVDAGNARNQIQNKELPFSYNQQGGVEVSYNFWLWKENEVAGDSTAKKTVYDRAVYPNEYDDKINAMRTDENKVNENQTADAGLHPRDIVLLLKGVRRVYEYKSMCNDESGAPIMKKDVLLKCPLIKFDRTTDRLTVEFNTFHGPDAVEENTAQDVCRNNASGRWSGKTRYKFSVSGLNDSNYIGKWFMVTVVLQDVTPHQVWPLRNKARCRIYINGQLKLEKYADGQLSAPKDQYSLIRENRAPLYIFPEVKYGTTLMSYLPTTEQVLRLGGLKYFNYAITDEEISGLVTARFNIKPMLVSSAVIDTPSWSSPAITDNRAARS